jgi:uncharacterized phiE125 gp8 family phage protein
MPNGWGLKLVTDATVEPITAAEAKTYARISSSTEDTLTESLIKSARRHAEAITQRQLVNATWRLTLDWFPSWQIILPRPPLSSVSSIVYDEIEEGTATTMSASDYRVQTDPEPGTVEPSYDAALWPTARVQSGAVRITYVAGYGAAGSSVPEDIRTAIKWLVNHWLEERLPTSEVPPAFRQMLMPFIVGETYSGVWDG